MEKWNVIKDFTNYEISDLGQVRNIKTKKILSDKKVQNGYKQVGLCVNGKPVRKSIHRLVAEMFVPNDDKKLTVNHKDGDKLNNKASNLEWMTSQENVNHAFTNNLTKVKVCPIIQFDLDDNEIDRFPSIKTIEEKLGYDRSAIIRVCKGRNKTAYGFKWKYVNGEDKIDDNTFKGQSYEDYTNYLINKEGQVYSKKSKKILKPVVNKNQHSYVTFSKDGKKRNFYIHVLVAKLYLQNPNNYSTVIHINKNKSDNKLVNLKWVKYFNQSSS